MAQALAYSRRHSSGSRCSAKVGIMMPRSRKRSAGLFQHFLADDSVDQIHHVPRSSIFQSLCA